MKKVLCLLMAMLIILPMVSFGTKPTAVKAVEAVEKKFVAFTFDDGPSSHTTTLLDGLGELGAKVTFFVNGTNGSMGAVNHKEKLTRMIAEGHQVANHTYAHRVPFDSLTAEEIQSEVSKVNTYLYEAMGDSYQTLVRTPGGATSQTIYDNVGAPIILWDVDTLDWKYRDAQQIYERIMNNVRDGSVVLLHDIYGTSVEGALKAMAELKEQGYEMVTVSEMYRRRGLSLENGKVYTRAYNPGVDKGALSAPRLSIGISSRTGQSSVSITSDDSNMTFYYTLDGSTPSPSSKRYTGPFDLAGGVTVRAMGVDKFGTRTSSVSVTTKQQYAGVFHAAYYLEQYPMLAQKYGSDETRLLNHYLTSGINEGMKASPVFDIEYYMANHADLKAAFGDNRIAYVLHFVQNGMAEGRRASEEFDVRSYCYAYVDLRQEFGNELTAYYMHYIQNGRSEGRTATGTTTMQNTVTVYDGVDYADVYDYQTYIQYHPEVLKTYGYDDTATLKFFVQKGMKLRHRASKQFSVESYFNEYPDLRNAYGACFEKYYAHYVQCGKAEGRIAVGTTTMKGYATVYNGVDYAAVYDYGEYINRYEQLLSTFAYNDEAVLCYFVNNGMKLGHQSTASLDPHRLQKTRILYSKLYGTDWAAYYQYYKLMR